MLYFRNDLEKSQVSKLKEIVNKFGGYLTESESEATHIIYPSVDPLEEEFARPVLKRDKMLMMHWYFLPDSYDSWVSLEYPEEVQQDSRKPSVPWRVSANWLIDSETYNEYMNETDYEVSLFNFNIFSHQNQTLFFYQRLGCDTLRSKI